MTDRAEIYCRGHDQWFCEDDAYEAALDTVRRERDKFDDEAERLGIERAEAWAERDRLREALERIAEMDIADDPRYVEEVARQALSEGSEDAKR